MILKFRGRCSFSELGSDEDYDSNSHAGTEDYCRIGERLLVSAIEDAEVEGIVTVAFPGFRFHGEIAYSTSSQDPKRLEETLTVNGQDLLALLRQHEGEIIWLWLADKPLNALQLTKLGLQYVGDNPALLHLEDDNLPEVALVGWENAYQCASEALLIERNDAPLIGLFVASVLATGRLADYGFVMLIQMLNRAIELMPEDSDLLHMRATLLELIGETERAAADRAKIMQIRRTLKQSLAERLRKAIDQQPQTLIDSVSYGDPSAGL